MAPTFRAVHVESLPSQLKALSDTGSYKPTLANFWPAAELIGMPPLVCSHASTVSRDSEAL